MRTEDEQIAWEIQCYGTTRVSIDRWLEDAKRMTDPLMLAMSILSDAQEILASEDKKIVSTKETARQYINKAKYIIGKERDKISLDK